MSYDKVPDDVLQQIAEGSGRTYPHEGKAMARELIEYRAQTKAAGSPQPGPTQHTFPWGGIP